MSQAPESTHGNVPMRFPDWAVVLTAIACVLIVLAGEWLTLIGAK